MQKGKPLLLKLYSNQRVDLAVKNYFSHLKIFIALTILFAISILGLFIYKNHITYSTLFISIGTIFLLIGFIGYFVKNAHSTSIKGDTLIIQSLSHKNIVTSIRSVKKITSLRIVGFQFTKLHYFLDGKKRTSLLINAPGTFPFSAAKFIQLAISKSKKTKANNKPGSVSLN